MIAVLALAAAHLAYMLAANGTAWMPAAPVLVGVVVAALGGPAVRGALDGASRAAGVAARAGLLFVVVAVPLFLAMGYVPYADGRRDPVAAADVPALLLALAIMSLAGAACAAIGGAVGGAIARARGGRVAPSPVEDADAGRRARVTRRLALASLAGVVALAPGLLLTDAAGSPLAAAMSLVQVALLVILAAAVGARVAPRIGLTSRIATQARGGTGAWLAFAPDVRVAALLGLGVAAVVIAGDLALGAGARGAAAAAPVPWPIRVGGVFYGALAEEVMFRWGLMSAIALGIVRLAPRVPATRVRAAASVATALVFAAGHLPMLFSYAPDAGGLLVARTIALNLVSGTAFGWICWRRGLEAGMVAHGAANVAIAATAMAAEWLAMS
jgi:hypothetical protein